MCQNQGQALYTRNARTRIVAIKLNMPNPFFALALGLCTQANFYQEKWGQAPLRSTLRLYRPRSRSGIGELEWKITPCCWWANPLRRTLSLQMHEALRQRIGVQYHLEGLTRDELDAYLAQQRKPPACRSRCLTKPPAKECIRPPRAFRARLTSCHDGVAVSRGE